MKDLKDKSKDEDRDEEDTLANLREKISMMSVPPGGGRLTRRDWTIRRLIPLSLTTFNRVGAITKTINEGTAILNLRVKVTPMQVASLLLEDAVDQAWTAAIATGLQEDPGGKG